jgi:hypothetical protein
MSDAQKSEELADLVSATLQRRGVLSDLKAKVRAEVYLALEEQSAADDDHHRSALLTQLAADGDARRALALVHEFLAHYGLFSTKSVLEAECPVAHGDVDRTQQQRRGGGRPKLVDLVATPAGAGVGAGAGSGPSMARRDVGGRRGDEGVSAASSSYAGLATGAAAAGAGGGVGGGHHQESPQDVMLEGVGPGGTVDGFSVDVRFLVERRFCGEGRGWWAQR